MALVRLLEPSQKPRKDPIATIKPPLRLAVRPVRGSRCERTTALRMSREVAWTFRVSYTHYGSPGSNPSKGRTGEAGLRLRDKKTYQVGSADGRLPIQNPSFISRVNCEKETSGVWVGEFVPGKQNLNNS